MRVAPLICTTLLSSYISVVETLRSATLVYQQVDRCTLYIDDLLPYAIYCSATGDVVIMRAVQNCTFIGRAEVSPTQVNSIEIFLFIEGLRVTSSPIETSIKFHVKFTSAWQARLAYKCASYSSHRYSSSIFSV